MSDHRQTRNGSWRSLARLLAMLAAAASIAPRAAHADQDLMLFPTRIVFDGSQRSAQLTVLNRGATAASYQVALVERRMSASGELATVTEPLPGERFATPLVRYSPHQFTVAPGGEQTIRVQVRKPSDLEPGEYRSHLLLKRLPDASAPQRESGEELSIQLHALVGASIPIIVRQGQLSAALALTNLEVHRAQDGSTSLSVDLNRRGERSVYGDLEVFASTPGKPERLVGKMRGMAVYTPNALRRVSVAIEREAAAGRLHVTFREELQGRSRPLAEATVDTR
jgi:P pilus assembly chaperone PapD